MTKIYTKTGDKGETSLFTGKRVRKNDPYIDALGTVDECNSAIGASLAFLPQSASQVRDQLTAIQHALFDLGAALATPRSSASLSKIAKTRFDHEGVELLEKWIDAWELQLPPLTTFILPGGHPAGAMLHVARSICRRAERLVVPINRETDVSDEVLMYLNRLSDYLFVVSRFVNHHLNSPETLWEQHKAINR